MTHWTLLNQSCAGPSGAVVLRQLLLERRVVVAGGLLLDGLRPRGSPRLGIAHDSAALVRGERDGTLRNVDRCDRGASERHDGEGHEGGRHRHPWGEEVEQPVHPCGGELFLEDEFESVGDRLEEAPRADAVRAETVLRPRRDLALQQHQIGAGALDDAEHDDDDDQRDPDVEVGVHRRIRRFTSPKRKQGILSKPLLALRAGIRRYFPGSRRMPYSPRSAPASGAKNLTSPANSLRSVGA